MDNTYKLFAVPVKIGLAIIFLIAISKMPYAYYEFVRVAGFVGFTLIAFTDYRSSNNTLAIFWASSAIIINPLVKVTLQKEYWHLIDVIWAATLLIAVLYDGIKLLPKNKPNWVKIIFRPGWLKRELIILVAVGGLTAVVWVMCGGYSEYYQWQTNILVEKQDAIQHQIDSINWKYFIPPSDAVETSKRVDELGVPIKRNKNLPTPEQVLGKEANTSNQKKPGKWEKNAVVMAKNNESPPPLPKGFRTVPLSDLIKEDSIRRMVLQKQDSMKNLLIQPLQFQHDELTPLIRETAQKNLSPSDINYYTLLVLYLIFLIAYPARLVYFLVRYARALRLP